MTTSKPTLPSAGGSYVRQPDGGLERREFTRQPGEPEAPAETPPPAAPAAKPAKRKEG